MHSKPLASIIIPVFNQSHYTKACLESLLRDTDRPPYEIIVIDNGSTDDTRLLLEQTARTLDHSSDVLVPIFNDTNRGVAPAWNQGLKAATTAYLAILNNDILLTTGWLRSLLWALQFHRLQLVSPFAATGPLHYNLATRAAQFTETNLGKLWMDYDFCAFLMPRSTYAQIGLFDENFLVGGYEDTDYAYRLKSAHMNYGVTGASFIHHFGSSTLGEFKRHGDKHVSHNRSYFISKWHVNPSLKSASFSAKLHRSWRKLKLHWDRM